MTTLSFRTWANVFPNQPLLRANVCATFGCMPKATKVEPRRYANQRPKLSQPVVTSATLRKAKGLTLQAVCDHMLAEFGIQTDRGTISAIENGHRGASARMLSAYADALGISTADINTQYEPRRRGEQGVA